MPQYLPYIISLQSALGIDIFHAGDICLSYSTLTSTTPQSHLACSQVRLRWEGKAEFASQDLDREYPGVHIS